MRQFLKVKLSVVVIQKVSHIGWGNAGCWVTCCVVVVHSGRGVDRPASCTSGCWRRSELRRKGEERKSDVVRRND